MSKSETISKIYYDKSGYGSKKVTLDDARKENNSITMVDVSEFFQKNVEQKKQLKGTNSFVAPNHAYEYQVDLLEIAPKRDADLSRKFVTGLVMIDIFSKYAVVIPMTDKTARSVEKGMEEGIEKIGKKPEIIYTDNDGALTAKSFTKWFANKGITHTVTRTHAHFAERFIRTFKDALFKRVGASEVKKNIPWQDFVYEILLTYNNKIKHSETEMTPAEAKKPSNEIDVKLTLLSKKKHERRYPLLSIGDKVKIIRKKEPGEKERTSVWSKTNWAIKEITKSHGQTVFKVEGMTRFYTRHENLKL